MKIFGRLPPHDANHLLLTNKSLSALRPQVTQKFINKSQYREAIESLYAFLDIPNDDPRRQNLDQALDKLNLKNLDQLNGVVLRFLFQLTEDEYDVFCNCILDEQPDLGLFKKLFTNASYTKINIQEWMENGVFFVHCENLGEVIKYICDDLIPKNCLAEASAVLAAHKSSINSELSDHLLSHICVKYILQKRLLLASQTASSIDNRALRDHYLAYITRALIREKDFSRAIAIANTISDPNKQRMVISAIFRKGLIHHKMFDQATLLAQSIPSPLKERLLSIITYSKQNSTEESTSSETPFEKKHLGVKKLVAALDFNGAFAVAEGEVDESQKDTLLKVIAIGLIELRIYQRATEISEEGSILLQESVDLLINESKIHPSIFFEPIE